MVHRSATPRSVRSSRPQSPGWDAACVSHLRGAWRGVPLTDVCRTGWGWGRHVTSATRDTHGTHVVVVPWKSRRVYATARICGQRDCLNNDLYGPRLREATRRDVMAGRRGTWTPAGMARPHSALAESEARSGLLLMQTPSSKTLCGKRADAPPRLSPPRPLRDILNVAADPPIGLIASTAADRGGPRRSVTRSICAAAARGQLTASQGGDY